MKSIFSIIMISLLLTNCMNSTIPNDPVPEHDTFKIKSAKVNEDRVINVWTPKDYQNTDQKYPVMYMADGGIKEDFPHIANTISILIDEKKIQPIILVGIENTQRRRDLTGPTEVDKDKEISNEVGGSANFRAFIKEELFAEINKRYRTNDHKSIIGESASGLFVMETFFLDPNMFDDYIAFDPALWWNDQYLVKNAKNYLDKLPSNQKRIWFAGSSATDIYPHTQSLAKIFEASKIPTLTWTYVDQPKEQHSTIFRATKEQAIIWTMNP